MTDRIDVVYRGPFQSRRIRLILDTIEQFGLPLFFVWIDPKKVGDNPPEFFGDFLDSRSSLEGGAYLPGAVGSTAELARSLRAAVGGRSDLAVAIGFTALHAVRLIRPHQLIWCINGIPEERLLYDHSVRSRLIVAGLWKSARIGPRPDVAVTVSKPMSLLVRSRLGIEHVVELPTAVDRAVFHPEAKDEPPVLNYVGSGAPWQNLQQLGDIWREIAGLHSECRFLVVSRDERARRAIDGLPSARAQLVPGHGPEHVAELTAGAALGFVVRHPHLVNEVSFPTKFGEYVASDTEVVTTDIGWDLADIVRSTGCGLLVDWRANPVHIARQIVAHLEHRRPQEQAEACRRAADELDRDHWIVKAGHAIGGVLGRTTSSGPGR